MENISDAVKMAGAALIFVLLLTVTLNLYRQARETSDIILYETDRTNYYQKIRPTQNGVTRVVGIETVIPTIYSYCHGGGVSVRIKLKNESKESKIHWSSTNTPGNNNSNDEEIFDVGLESELNGSNATKPEDYIKNLSDKYGSAPWKDDRNKQLERINAFLYGGKLEYASGWYLEYIGSFVDEYKNSTFTESYVEYNTGGKYKNDGWGNWYTIVDGTKKVIITYTYNKDKNS